MKKYVIYKDAFGYKCTDENNYNSRIQDANKIITIKECYTMHDAVLTVKTWSKLTDDQIIIKEV